MVSLPSNPFAVLTFISAPAVLTNASCVLLFGTGNRYGRAIDRVHELTELLAQNTVIESEEIQFRMRQLESAENRTLLIVQSLTCFYTAVAGFVASTLTSLIGALLVSAEMAHGVSVTFSAALACGTIGVAAMIAGAVMLVRETRFSYGVLVEENRFTRHRLQARIEPTQ